MRVKLNKAVKMFFGNSSLEMVYFEAVANALDANANRIDINISISDYNQPDSLVITIEDNGIGFTDERFHKFSNLFDVEDPTHKGLGRLVYICYFEKVLVCSYYEGNKKRTFEFSESFNEESAISYNDTAHPTGSILSMTGYTFSKLKQYSFIEPKYLKWKILERFYSRLYKMKLSGNSATINITLKTKEITETETLTGADIPAFDVFPMEGRRLDLISNVELFYHIEKVEPYASNVITAISVDERTYPLDIIAKENIPLGYKMIFLLYSDYFDGKVDATRETLTTSEIDKVKLFFRNIIISIIANNLPEVAQRNKDSVRRLINRFPHLNGYIDQENVGFATADDVLRKAQEKYLRAQREILNASHLTEEQYNKSMDLASRSLTEYVLFRQNVIAKLKCTDSNDKEAVIHNLIVPMHETFEKEQLTNDLYRNNIWILDDKYMTYDTVLSDRDMTDLISAITEGEETEKDDDRPDIAIIFSGNPKDDTLKKVNVVIVELKRKGLSTEDNSIVEIQLENRARKLARFYKNKIQQIWFYGIVEFNEEFEMHLESDYHKLFSNGKVYYRNKDVVTQREPKESVPVGIFIMDFDAVVQDADARNSTFLNIIKGKFKL